MVIKNAIKSTIHMRTPPTGLDHNMVQPNYHAPPDPKLLRCPERVTYREA